MSKQLTTLSLILGSALLLAACPEAEAPPAEETVAVPAAPAEPAEPDMAVAQLTGAPDATVTGVVTFTEEAGGVRILAEIEGAEPGTHGLHLHENGDCTPPTFESAGGHFNPAGVDHGGPDAMPHHAGDFGNVEIGEDGTGRLELVSDQLSVGDPETAGAGGPWDAVGHAVILHAQADDLTTQPTGDAGGRVACGLVEMASPGVVETEETITEPLPGEEAGEEV